MPIIDKPGKLTALTQDARTAIKQAYEGLTVAEAVELLDHLWDFVAEEKAALRSLQDEVTGKPCDCPSDASADSEGIEVGGHTIVCVHGEPRRYAWEVEGSLCVGTLADYAKDWEHGQYGAYALSAELRTWDRSYQVEVKYLGTDDQDYMRHLLIVDNESYSVHIDGRA